MAPTLTRTLVPNPTPTPYPTPNQVAAAAAKLETEARAEEARVAQAATLLFPGCNPMIPRLQLYDRPQPYDPQTATL